MANIYQIDLDRVANSPVTEGIHTFEIIGGEEGEGAKGAYWRFTLACKTPGEENKSASFIVSLSPQSRWRLELFLDAVRAPKKGTATIDKFIGRTFRAKVVHEEFEGRVQARLTDLFPAISEAPKTTQVVQPMKIVKASVQRPLPTDVIGEQDEFKFEDTDDSDENS